MKKAILATKVGMTQVFNDDGALVPVTVLQAGPCVVTRVKTKESDGYDAVQVAFGEIRAKLGFVLQNSDNPMFMPTVYEDMIFGPLNYGLPREEVDRRVDEVLARLNLEYIKGELDAYGASFNSTYVPSSVSFDIPVPVLDAGNPNFQKDAPCQVMTLTLGVPGRYIDIENLYNQILDAYSFNKFLVTAQMDQEEQLPDAMGVKAKKELLKAYYDCKYKALEQISEDYININ